MIIKDATVIIHLAKTTLLERSCEYFKEVIMPETVFKEVKAGKEHGHEDVFIVESLVTRGKIKVKKIRDAVLIQELKEYNIQGGEAEAVALYWQERAGYLATDDDNVRRKARFLSIHVIGTPSIILSLYKEGWIKKEKFAESTTTLKKIGWFSNEVIDKMNMEASRWNSP